MKKWICDICGYIYEGEKLPKECPICNATSEKFRINLNKYSYDNNFKVGIANDLDESLKQELRENFNIECREVAIYLAMSKIAQDEGYNEISQTYKTIALEEAYHATNFARLLGEDISCSIEEDLKYRIKSEYGATQNKIKLSKKVKELGLDSIYSVINGMCKDEANHSKEFINLLNKYFDYE